MPRTYVRTAAPRPHRDHGGQLPAGLVASAMRKTCTGHRRCLHMTFAERRALDEWWKEHDPAVVMPWYESHRRLGAPFVRPVDPGAPVSALEAEARKR